MSSPSSQSTTKSSNQNNNNHNNSNNLQLCRVISEAKYTARSNRYNRTKPQPWLVRKLMVFVTLGIIGYTGYVYIGRFCVGILSNGQHGDGMGRRIGRGAGIAMLVIFCVLYFWMLWAYAKVVLVSPGFARDYIPKTPPPAFPPPRTSNMYGYTVPLELDNENADGNDHDHHYDPDRDSIGGPSYEDIARSEFSDTPARPARARTRTYSYSRYGPGYGREEAGVLNAIPLPVPNAVAPGASASGPTTPAPAPAVLPRSLSNHNTDPNAPLSTRLQAREAQRLARDLDKVRRHNAARRPPTVPVLLPEHRYCSRDEIVKPYRAHHCRSCGTCVLRYDHHCPWIGQCVGARNHKFFVNFNFATSIFTAYTFGTLLAFTVRSTASSSFLPGSRPKSIDVQEIVIIALSALFFIFTAALLISHLHLLSLSQTTVESIQYRTLTEREDRKLAEVFGFCALRRKQRVKRAWDEEWGRIGKEGNLWWVGGGWKGLEETMGSLRRTKGNPWGWVAWVLPVDVYMGREGRGEEKREVVEGNGNQNRNGGKGVKEKDMVGLCYEPNPRFDEQGVWRPRRDWPEQLR
ncbi:hypothetical protein VKT23_014304 [Stygiomarasmius scandens]|uniref:Palmitoyltransferase n=1 Tax=Marasmiellus scandens TaxID=2682957 RepID=A0ABR1J5Z2_9AGAR